MAVVFPHTVEARVELPGPEAVERVAEAAWVGRANVLSAQRTSWPIIDEAVDATTKPRTETVSPALAEVPEENATPGAPAARTLLLQRRSAVDYDGQTTMPRKRFYRALSRTLPVDRPPWDAVPWPPSVHLAIFVHRVEGLVSGLYLLVRNAEHAAELRSRLRDDFAWTTPPKCPESLPLVQLGEGDLRLAAAQIVARRRLRGTARFRSACWRALVRCSRPRRGCTAASSGRRA